MTHASRNTTTGLDFEKVAIANHKGIKLDKRNLYKYLEEKGIDWSSIISRQILPDDAYYNPKTGEFAVYEKKVSTNRRLR